MPQSSPVTGNWQHEPAGRLGVSSSRSEPVAMAALPPRPALIRVTHWVNAISFVALAVSGVAILLAHPRLYWGETGAIGAPSLLDLPLPMLLTGQSGWGRYLHFLAAWGCVLSGAVYVLSGLRSGHFRRDVLPSRGGRGSPLMQYVL